MIFLKFVDGIKKTLITLKSEDNFLSFSDYKGGASIAAYSIFKSIKKNILFLTAYKKFKNSKEIYSSLKKFIFSI